LERIQEKINRLKDARRAVILAHNYQRPEIQDIADFTGDSLGLSRQAAKTDAEVIVFCGVYFMAETAKLISPQKTVLIPDPNAGCPMANMITEHQLIEAKRKHPDAVVVCYVNSTAAIKALSDICVTSGNAVEVCNRIPKDKPVLFVPDAHLGRYVAEKLGREFILWDGYCPTHQRITPDLIERARKDHPGALVVVHPECMKQVVDMADHVASTTGIQKYCRESPARAFIIGTEHGMMHKLKKENPGKEFFPASPFGDCPNMKLVTLEKLLWSLEDMVYEVTVPEDVAVKARHAIDQMLL
jgi:quinolinate synthase